MTVHEELLDLLRAKYEPKEDAAYEEQMDFLWISLAPERYLVEEEILSYAKAHPDATLRELNFYFDEIAPEGLPPGEDDAEEGDDY